MPILKRTSKQASESSQTGLLAYNEKLTKANRRLRAKIAEMERKQAEEALRGSEEELLRSNAQLAETDRRKDEFLAMLAHELRNPLAPIRISVELLRNHVVSGNEKASRWTETIRRQVDHLTRILDDLLDTSRISRGLIALKKKPVILNNAIAQAVETVQSEIDSKHQNLNIRLSNEQMVLDADQVRLVQIFTNLLNNASKYTPAEGRVWLRTRQENGMAVIEVEDTGIGIPPEILPHIFEVFFQANKNLDRIQGGLGLGLTLVRQLTLMHGGQIEAKSAGVNQGSLFSLHLPLAAVKHQASAVAAATSPSERPRLKVLLVEDNHDSAESMVDLLQLWGYESRLAFDGSSAITIALEFRPNVILMDIGLPGMDGYEAAQRLHSEPSLASTVLLALTGYNVDSKRMAKSGFKQHFTKPVAPDKLEACLLELAQRRKPGKRAKKRVGSHGK
jgi:signal transduction histidine kinase/CheY-like chemotaxis protein